MGLIRNLLKIKKKHIVLTTTIIFVRQLHNKLQLQLQTYELLRKDSKHSVDNCNNNEKIIKTDK